MELFEVLANRRRQIKMSFEDLSAASKIPVSTLKKIFTGITANPPFETVRCIAYAMGITTDDVSAAMDQSVDYGLSPSALSIARKYDALDDHGKEVVEVIVDLESQRVERITYASEVARFNAMTDDEFIESSSSQKLG